MDTIRRKTHTIDASGQVLGRLAVKIAILLRGKHKPEYLPRLDQGDFVAVKNIDKIKVTGKKFEDKIYYHHTGYLGNMKKASYKEVFAKDPSRVLRVAVWGMMPKNRIRAKQIRRLKFI